METNYDLRAAILASPGEGGVRSVAKKLRVGQATVIRTRKQMQDEGLIEICRGASKGPGRPEEQTRITALGRAYLNAYGALRATALRSSEQDLRRAASDGKYAQRLSARGLSTADLFLELDSVAWSSRKTTS